MYSNLDLMEYNECTREWYAVSAEAMWSMDASSNLLYLLANKKIKKAMLDSRERTLNKNKIFEKIFKLIFSQENIKILKMYIYIHHPQGSTVNTLLRILMQSTFCYAFSAVNRQE